MATKWLSDNLQVLQTRIGRAIPTGMIAVKLREYNADGSWINKSWILLSLAEYRARVFFRFADDSDGKPQEP